MTEPNLYERLGGEPRIRELAGTIFEKGNTDSCTRSRWRPQFSETRRVAQRVVVLPASGATQDRGTGGTNPTNHAMQGLGRPLSSKTGARTALRLPCAERLHDSHRALFARKSDSSANAYMNQCFPCTHRTRRSAIATSTVIATT